MRKRYLLVGFSIILLLGGLVKLIRLIRGEPPAVTIEPWKIKGNPTAPLYIVVYSDFACPYCNRIRPTLDKIIQTYPNDVKILFKHFPLMSHPMAPEAAEATECAADQGRFWEYHDKLFDNVGHWFNSENVASAFTQYAKEFKLNVDQFNRCYDSHIKKSVVEANKTEGRHMFVSGTPTLLLNGRKVIVKDDFESIKALIETHLKDIKK